MSKSKIFLVITAAFLIILFQQCAPQFVADPPLNSSKDFRSTSLVPNRSLGNGLLSLREKGTLLPAGSATSCLNDTQFDACLFLKNPVAQRQQSFSSGPLQEDDLRLQDEQRFGIKFTGLTGTQPLASNHFQILSVNPMSDQVQVSDIQRSYRVPLSTDTEYRNEQASLYFYLQNAVEEFVRRIGGFYASQRQLVVESSVDQSGAYFEWTARTPQGRLVFGKNQQQGQATISMALNAEVVLHELAHANFHFSYGQSDEGLAVLRDVNSAQVVDVYRQNSSGWELIRIEARAIYRTEPIAESDLPIGPPTPSGNEVLKTKVRESFCLTAQGCILALSEGQADFFTYTLFPNDLGMGDTLVNNLGGALGSGFQDEVQRNPLRLLQYLSSENLRGKTKLEYIFSKSTSAIGTSGEHLEGNIYGMGAAFSTMLWQIYSDERTDRRLFEIEYMQALASLNSESDFTAYFQTLLGIDQGIYQSRNSIVITEVMQGWGL